MSNLLDALAGWILWNAAIIAFVLGLTTTVALVVIAVRL